MADGELVDHGVERDRATGEEREPGTLRAVAPEKPKRVAGKEIGTEDDERRAGYCEHSRSLAEKAHGGDDGEHRPGRARSG